MTAAALFHWLQRTSLEASLLILAVLGLRVLLGSRLSPAWRVGLWMLIGAKLLLPAFIPAGFGLGMLGREPSDRMGVHESRFDVAAVQVAAPFLSETPAPASPPSLSLLQGVLAVWGLGGLSVIGIALLRQRRFQRQLDALPSVNDPKLVSLLTRLASQAHVATPQILLISPGCTPALVGLRQPKILLPGDWSSRFTDRSLRHVLLHELLHIRHRDLLWNWIATAVQALHWFNPLVWLVVSRFQADRELRCDAGALAILAPAERLDYGRTLLSIQETFFAPPAIAGLAPCVRRQPALRQRLHMIATQPSRHPGIHALLVLTLSVLVGYSFTTARAAEKEVPPKVREGSTTRPKPSDASEKSDKKPAMKEGEREGGKPSAERDGQRKPVAERDGEKKPGMRDGDRPRTGPRDGEGMQKSGEGEGRRPSAESGRGSRPGAEGRATPASGEILSLHVTAGGDTILVDGKKVPANRLRGFLSTFLPEHSGARIEVSGDERVTLNELHQVVDAVRDNGNKNVGVVQRP